MGAKLVDANYHQPQVRERCHDFGDELGAKLITISEIN